MLLDIKNKKNIFILGAGSSMEYGLPSWNQLISLIEEEIKKDVEDVYKHKNEILEWLHKVGVDKEYSTIDECITKESINYHEDGHLIEDEVFSIMKSILENKYIDNSDGWIATLNKKIITNEIQDLIYFINYNYDSVIYKNFLNYKHLSSKEKKVLFASRLYDLNKTELNCFCPHGKLSEDIGNFNIIVDTHKTEREFIDAVTCHDSKEHEIYSYNYLKIKLFILGLGGGIFVNLDKLIFNYKVGVEEIFITIKDDYKKDEILNYLVKKFDISLEKIKVFNDCKELIDKNF